MNVMKARGDINRELDELWATIQELREASLKLETVADKVIVQIKQKETELGNGD